MRRAQFVKEFQFAYCGGLMQVRDLSQLTLSSTFSHSLFETDSLVAELERCVRSLCCVQAMDREVKRRGAGGAAAAKEA